MDGEELERDCEEDMECRLRSGKSFKERRVKV